MGRGRGKQRAERPSETLDIRVLRGRTFDPGDDRAVIVSDSLASRLWPDQSALGRRLRLGPEVEWLEVVGVAADVPSAWNDRRPAASAYVPFRRSPSSRMSLLVHIDGDAALAADAIRDAIWSIDDSVVVFAPQTIGATLEADAGPLRASSELVIGMAIAALLVCLSGVYALVAHTAGRRTREIGVRMALGAGRRQVVRMLVVEGVTTSGLGLLIGLAMGLAVAVMLQRFLQGTVATDARLLIGLAMAMLALVALSSWLPARRASRTDPASTLKAE